MVLKDLGAKIILSERLDHLEKEGFTLYEYHNGELKSCSAFELSLFKPNHINDSHLTEKALLSIAGKQLHLGPDKLYVLNEKSMQSLMHGDDSDWTPDTYDVMDLSCSNLSGASLTRLVAQHGAAMVSLNISGCLNLTDATILNAFDLTHLRKLNASKIYVDIPVLKDRAFREMSLSPQIINVLLLRSNKLEDLDLSGLNAIDVIFYGVKGASLKDWTFPCLTLMVPR